MLTCLHRHSTSATFISVGCACGDRECCLVTFSKTDILRDGGLWRCNTLNPRKCSTVFDREARQATTAYEVGHLAHFIASKTTLKTLNLAQVRVLLGPYVRADPGDAWLLRLVEAARWVKMGGTPEQALQKLFPLAQAARDKGWKVKIETQTAEELVQTMRTYCKAAHKSKDGPFDETKLPKVDSDKIYITNMFVSPPWAQEAFNNLARVSNTDYAFTNKIAGMQ